MKTIVFLLLASLIIAEVYAEERLSDIRLGTSCNMIPETEKRLGSIELAVDDSNGIRKYSGTFEGKKATIVYYCNDGRLTEQTVIITSATQDEAYRFANEQKASLILRLGDPIHDGLSLGIGRRIFFGILGADLDYLTRVVVWGRAKEDTMLEIKEIGNELWEVSISQGSSKLAYILNS
ncbi:MAG: hypothetical protein KZQ84_19430 [Candidatus Thiodiazotropha sp. (ex Lucinoma borealis)]|nr:hypothetical protein [Candidatus Thiodiazotropha sp. (ex Lucinoma borealis)]